MRKRKIENEDVEKVVEYGELEFTKSNEKGRGTEYYYSLELKKQTKTQDNCWLRV